VHGYEANQGPEIRCDMLLPVIDPAERTSTAHAHRMCVVGLADLVFREGERASSLYVIEAGIVSLSRNAVVLTQLSTGAAFGEDSLVGHQHENDAGLSLVNLNAKATRERTATALVESDLVVLEVRDLAPIAEAHPALHARLGEFHSKRTAREQQRLTQMLEAKAKELGVSPDSAIISKSESQTGIILMHNCKQAHV
jgi:CRP-like cAMP-binding protein